MGQEREEREVMERQRKKNIFESPCFSVQIKHNNDKNEISVKQGTKKSQ